MERYVRGKTHGSESEWQELLKPCGRIEVGFGLKASDLIPGTVAATSTCGMARGQLCQSKSRARVS
jgi:hypothetical protein